MKTPTKPLSKNPLYEPCTNPDCVGGHVEPLGGFDPERDDTCETCDGHEYVRRESAVRANEYQLEDGR